MTPAHAEFAPEGCFLTTLSPTPRSRVAQVRAQMEAYRLPGAVRN